MKEETKKNNGWGGARKGSGRKKNGSRQFSFQASADVVEVVEKQKNRSQFLNECVKAGLLAQNISRMASEEINLTVEAEGEQLPRIGVYDTELPVACGNPLGLGDVSHMELSDLSRFLVPKEHPARACRVSGESMIGAKMFPGDIVLCDVSPRVPSESDVALCELNGEYTFKYIRRHDGKVWLVPDNPEYQEREVQKTDEFHVRGIVTSVVHLM